MIKKVVYWLPDTQTMEVTLAHAGTGIPVGNLMICYMKGTLTKWRPVKVLLTRVLTRLKQQVCTETLTFLAVRMH